MKAVEIEAAVQPDDAVVKSEDRAPDLGRNESEFMDRQVAQPVTTYSLKAQTCPVTTSTRYR